MTEQFEKIVEVHPAYDHHTGKGPSGKKGGGHHGCEIRFVLKGQKGAVQFLIMTDWMLPSSREWLKASGFGRGFRESVREERGFMAADVGYHAVEPQYEGQGDARPCPYTSTGKCYYDGSGCLADEWAEGFIAGGTEWLWKKLEERYYGWLCGKDNESAA